MKTKLLLYSWLLLNLAGVYFCVSTSIPTVIASILVWINVLLVTISYVMGLLHVFLMISLFASSVFWVGTHAYAQWGYTKFVAYPLYGITLIGILVLLRNKRKFEINEPKPWVKKWVVWIKRMFGVKETEMNALEFILGDEEIDCKYPNQPD